jgi:2-phospho-L-lactate guanylyltransferase (CobY/MobA/RfbA family)
MTAIVVPFREDGKERLGERRAALARAMLDDVLAACAPVGAAVVADAAGGQGAAVEAALADVGEETVLVVNADLPCLSADDLVALADAVPEEGLAVAPAGDGTTNALGLSRPSLFAPLYGPGSAEEFRAHASQLGVPSVVVRRPGLADDVDTLTDLERLADRVGPRTKEALTS